ncbi:hypothetical protein DFH06DRAFT_1014905, partial [Mycena polygramma]
QSRQEVCESLPYFRSYQGGVYQNNGVVRGYFLSAFSADRDCFEAGGKLIISHAGGKAQTSRTHRGQLITRPAADQRPNDIPVKALMHNYHQGIPLVVLIDDRYPFFPLDLAKSGVYMTVLGFYRIIHAWGNSLFTLAEQHTTAEGTTVVRYKFAFQWCAGQGEPWWSENYDPDPLKPRSLYNTCTVCHELSPLVFFFVVCLNSACRSFFTTRSAALTLSNARYNPKILEPSDGRPLPQMYLETLIPEPHVFDLTSAGSTTSYAASRGSHCGPCGRLFSRYASLACLSPRVSPAQISLAQARMPSLQGISHRITQTTTQFGSVKIQTFTFPDSRYVENSFPIRHCILTQSPTRGKVHLIPAQHGHAVANRIFLAYQNQAASGDLILQRMPLKMVMRGSLLTNYYSQNCMCPSPLRSSTQLCLLAGEPYHVRVYSVLSTHNSPPVQYVAGTDATVPFNLAPSAVLDAHALIGDRILKGLGLKIQFNEVLRFENERFHPPQGDVCFMQGAGIQEYYEYLALQIPSNFRIAATARWIEPQLPN